MRIVLLKGRCWFLFISPFHTMNRIKPLLFRGSILTAYPLPPLLAPSPPLVRPPLALVGLAPPCLKTMSTSGTSQDPRNDPEAGPRLISWKRATIVLTFALILLIGEFCMSIKFTTDFSLTFL